MEHTNLTTKIHSTESFGTVDGPGIRYVIFTQGCPLRCRYCHNPDTWNTNEGNLVSVDDLMKEIISYKSYMQFSNGGVTVSGGEPLLHIPFLIELFKRCKEEGIHTAIDTSGHVELTADIDELLSYTDLVLLDIKHIDDTMHQQLTGKSNQKTLNFAKYLNQKNIPVWVRYVVVADYTEDVHYAEQLADFVSTLSNIEKVELLPYHELGKYKWETLGLNYTLKDVIPPSKDTMENIKNVFVSRGINVLV